MRCHKPETEQEASVQVFVNGFLCTEYVLPNASSDDPNVIESFVSVSDGEKITLKLRFQGTLHAGSIDVLADGSFLADKRIENRDTKSIRHASDVLKVFDTLKADATNDLKEQIVECDLLVSPLNRPRPQNTGSKFGVGSLAVIISAGQFEHERYEVKPAYPSTYCGDWSNRADGPDGGIPPTHELAVKVTDDTINRNRQTKHLRHFKEIRFGKKPWATFIFYYRSRAAIESAKCIIRPNKSHPLQPSVADLDTRASVEEGAAAEQTNQPPIAGNAPRGSFMMPPPPPLPKKKLFGQPLFPPGTKVTHPDDISPSPGNDRSVNSPALYSPTPPLAVGMGSATPSASPHPPTSFSRKRSISADGISREHTRNKKPRMSDKKAALLAELEEKTKRADEAVKRREEKKRQREEEEQRKRVEEEAAEIEDLQRQIAEKDQVLEDLEGNDEEA